MYKYTDNMNKIKSKANKWKQTIFVTGNGRFFAAVRINGRSQFLGTFSKEDDARKSVNVFLASKNTNIQPVFQFY